ncbi:hypothetical protein SLEP1_g34426 [Rubroshorea leprosula]|uniref:Uncharacterized protein n=1 Tax=Rubroshorea leprosula TaxID=152421 RepID=A0AAV5KJY6_9ROSI|nr:hypothetical protein SLEP1_g34426 [Rubroshorea leprosula]
MMVQGSSRGCGVCITLLMVVKGEDGWNMDGGVGGCKGAG